MSGGGRRGRRGGRRQRRREEQRRAAEAQPRKTNGQSGPGHPAPVQSATVAIAPAPPAAAAAAVTVAPAPPAAAAAVPDAQPAAAADSAAEVAHPRPMSARELVARLEAMRAEASAHEHAATTDAAGSHAPAESQAHAAAAEPAAAAREEPRLFHALGADWVARSAGRGTGGTGRVAQARIDAIRFSPAAEPERVAAEVIVPHVRLDDLYDDELAELLERGLRSRKSE